MEETKYLLFVENAYLPQRIHLDKEVARKEGERLSKELNKRVFLLTSVEEIKVKEPNICLNTFEKVKKYMLSTNDFIAQPAEITNAFYQLLVAAKAWNSMDNFEPKTDGVISNGWIPYFFCLNNVEHKFTTETSKTLRTLSRPYSHIICFKTQERAEQFIKTFKKSWEIYLNTPLV